MVLDSYLYNLSYVASQRSFSRGRLHESVLTALTEGAAFNIEQFIKQNQDLRIPFAVTHDDVTLRSKRGKKKRQNVPFVL